MNGKRAKSLERFQSVGMTNSCLVSCGGVCPLPVYGVELRSRRVKWQWGTEPWVSRASCHFLFELPIWTVWVLSLSIWTLGSLSYFCLDTTCGSLGKILECPWRLCEVAVILPQPELKKHAILISKCHCTVWPSWYPLSPFSHSLSSCFSSLYSCTF